MNNFLSQCAAAFIGVCVCGMLGVFDRRVPTPVYIEKPHAAVADRSGEIETLQLEVNRLREVNSTLEEKAKRSDLFAVAQAQQKEPPMVPMKAPPAQAHSRRSTATARAVPAAAGAAERSWGFRSNARLPPVREAVRTPMITVSCRHSLSVAEAAKRLGDDSNELTEVIASFKGHKSGATYSGKMIVSSGIVTVTIDQISFIAGMFPKVVEREILDDLQKKLR